MTWQECFEKYQYQPIISEDTDGKRILKIDMFLHQGNVPEELRQIYLSAQRDELFLILQPKPGTDVETFCSRWDSRIMAFINFGDLPDSEHEAVKNLQYNITQILLYTNESTCETGNLPLMRRPTNFSEEKSVSISRKIFLQCGVNDFFDYESRLLLPFWYEELERGIFDTIQEESLNALLPKDDAIEFLCKERSKLDRRLRSISAEQLNFTDEEFAAVKGWLVP